MKNITGKILSIVFLLHLLLIQGVNLAEARHQAVPVSNNDSQKHFTGIDEPGVTLSILSETEEDDDEKLFHKITLIQDTSQPIKFFAELVGFSFPLPNAPTAVVLPEQNNSLLKVHCCFLI